MMYLVCFEFPVATFDPIILQRANRLLRTFIFVMLVADISSIWNIYCIAWHFAYYFVYKLVHLRMKSFVRCWFEDIQYLDYNIK